MLLVELVDEVRASINKNTAPQPIAKPFHYPSDAKADHEHYTGFAALL